MAKRTMVILVDGPEGNSLPEHARDAVNDPIRILRGNGYERFEFYGEYADVGGESVPVYRWCYRTQIAE